MMYYTIDSLLVPPFWFQITDVFLACPNHDTIPWASPPHTSPLNTIPGSLPHSVTSSHIWPCTIYICISEYKSMSSLGNIPLTRLGSKAVGPARPAVGQYLRQTHNIRAPSSLSSSGLSQYLSYPSIPS